MLNNDKYYTADEVVSLAESRIGDVPRDMRRVFRAWVWDAVAQIGPDKWQLKTEDIINEKQRFEIPKPDYCLSVKKISVFKNGSEVKYQYNRSKKIHEGNENSVGVVYLYETAHHFIVSDCDVDCIKVTYWSMLLDENGEILIPDHYIDAVSTYIQALWEGRSGNFLAKEQTYYNRWLSKKRRAKAYNGTPSVVEAADLAQKWTSMIKANGNKYRD
jgi:hypothetical protein